jgi:hypothetical protein
MAQLSTFRFTNLAAGDFANAATDSTTGGWQNTAVSPIQALGGEDIIQSIGVFADLGATGTNVPVFGPTSAYYVGTPTLLYNAAIANGGGGAIDMGAGRDLLTASTSGLRSIGILNGKIGGSNTTERLVMGIGEDSIVGINVSAASASTYGIYNTGTIDLGTGNDTIQGIKSSTAATGAAIFNSGTILGGTGDDTFDALTGGWAGTGTVDGGAGADVLKGFGSGTFNGGAGLKDEIILGEGNYTLKYSAIPTATVAKFALTRNGDATKVMTIEGFEAITSNNPLAAGIHPTAVDGLRTSAFSIDADGLFTSVTLVGARSAL